MLRKLLRWWLHILRLHLGSCGGRLLILNWLILILLKLCLISRSCHILNGRRFRLVTRHCVLRYVLDGLRLRHHVLLARSCHEILRLLRHLGNILLVRLRHHGTGHEVLRSRWSLCSLRLLVAVRGALEINFIQLPGIAPEAEVDRSAGRTWDLITKDVKALSVNIFAIDELQHVTGLDTLALVGRPIPD